MNAKFKSSLFLLVILLSFSACGGGGSGGGGGEPANVAGVWDIHEAINDQGCGGTGSTDDYNVTVTQNGSSIAVTDNRNNSYSGAVNGNTVSWTGNFPDPQDASATITITSLTL